MTVGIDKPGVGGLALVLHTTRFHLPQACGGNIEGFLMFTTGGGGPPGSRGGSGGGQRGPAGGLGGGKLTSLLVLCMHRLLLPGP